MSTARRALRTVLLALLFAFAIGFGVGTWLRCRMEKPPVYIGSADYLRPAHSTSDTPARRLATRASTKSRSERRFR